MNKHVFPLGFKIWSKLFVFVSVVHWTRNCLISLLLTNLSSRYATLTSTRDKKASLVMTSSYTLLLDVDISKFCSNVDILEAFLNGTCLVWGITDVKITWQNTTSGSPNCHLTGCDWFFLIKFLCAVQQSWPDLRRISFSDQTFFGATCPPPLPL